MAVRKFLKYLLPEIAPTERNRKKQTHGIALSFPVVRVLKSELRSPGGRRRPEETEKDASSRYLSATDGKAERRIGPAVRIASVRSRDHKVFAVRRRSAFRGQGPCAGACGGLLSDDHFRRSASKAVWRSACVPDSVRRSDASARPVRLRAATDRPASREAPR